MKKISVTQLGEMVKKWRDQLGLSQEELGKRVGLNAAFVSEIEGGGSKLSLESINKLAIWLETSRPILFPSKNNTSRRSRKPVVLDKLAQILLVEDNMDDAELAIRALKRSGMANRVDVVRDGEEALDFLFRTGKYEHRRTGRLPNLILLDLHLPKVDGLEVLRRLKADGRTASIPVVVLTGSKEERELYASKGLGADAYLVKGADFKNLSQVTPQLNLKWGLIKSPQRPRV